MRRVVVTGLGIVSSIGNNAHEVLASLREAKSGVIAASEYAELGFRCQVHAAPQIDWEALSRIGPSGEAAEAVLADLLGVSRSASYAVGEIVVMTGLREVEFNGSIGRVVSVDRADNRYTVDVDGGPLSVRGQNLQSATLVHDLSAPPRRREYDDGTD